jgi:5-methylcytosine-specific restriction endonuclease McrA
MCRLLAYWCAGFVLAIAVFGADLVPLTPVNTAVHDAPEKAPESKRSGHWPKVRADFLVDHPTCAACGTTEQLQVHHVVPFHRDGAELDPKNLIVLCQKHGCHFIIGHAYNFKGWNSHVREDAALMLKRKLQSDENARLDPLPKEHHDP